jgi:hypothetical protein
MIAVAGLVGLNLGVAVIEGNLTAFIVQFSWIEKRRTSPVKSPT